MNEPIDNFRGPHGFLSNFWPCSVVLEEVIYDTVENAYVAAKTLDLPLRYKIAEMRPGPAKRFGRTLTLRSDWEEVKLPLMHGLLQQKFNSENLRHLLLSTGDRELIEGNNWGDTFWGVYGGKGHNHLGKLLMRVRSELRGEEL